MNLSDLKQGSNAAGVADRPDTAPVVVIGAGPAGLTAAHELTRNGKRCLVLEAGELVGGLSRTEQYKGYLFDIGGHRFFTKVNLIQEFWRDILGDDFLLRPRLSRIHYRGLFFRYPLEPIDALRKLGIVEAIRCLWSYLLSSLMPLKPETTFDAWITNRFGRRLFTIFFKSYTEKVWGIPCSQIQADWAAQRIQGLSLGKLIGSYLLPWRGESSNREVVKTLIHEFYYPRFGPGMMWERCRDLIEERNAKVILRAQVDRVCWEPGRVTAVEACGSRFEGSHFISSMPIRHLIRALDPAPPADVLHAANSLCYRDFLLLALVIRGKDLFPDNWIYVHEPDVRVARIQNFKNWSEDMVPDSEMTCLGLEYFCFEGDDIWNMADSDLISLGRKELGQLGLADPDLVVDGKVIRVPKAYPVYDAGYQEALAVIQEFLAAVPNLQLVGRNGMHKYNNQDHSMLTGILAARNILGARYNLWDVNVDSSYQEEGVQLTEEDFDRLESTQPYVPTPIA